MKTFKFSLVLRTRENTDVFISLDDNIYGIHSKRINILYLLPCFIESPVFNANSVDPDQTPHSAASDMGLHCFQYCFMGR